MDIKNKRLIIARGGDWEVGKMGEGSQKMQTSKYNVNKSWDVTHSMATIVNNIIFAYLKVAEKVNLKNPHHKENNCNHVW